jgi:hypothetical protein
MTELNLLANAAATLPITRLWVSFFSPTMYYLPGSNTLANTGMNLTNDADSGFAALQAATKLLKAAGVQVFISMGGWNYNCFPYAYARYSVGGYGNNTPNYWKIATFGKGNIDNCVEDNLWCFTCEPPSEGDTIDNFSIFPEPTWSPTWQQAQQYVEKGKNASQQAPIWSSNMIPGQAWTDPKTGIQNIIPGMTQFVTLKRDPYQDVVHLATDLGCDGIDLDYEEMWHGDYFKVGANPGPWQLPQTTYKYTAIAVDIMINIQTINKNLRLSTAAGAVGAWSSNWWGGDLKGLWFNVKQWYPEIMSFMATGSNAGGVNVMTYDLSDNPQFHECPNDNTCTLPEQVDFYMGAFANASIPANVGYEVGIPAYPDHTHDPSHDLPLTMANLKAITTTTQPKYKGGFIWEMYKLANSTGNASPTQTLQAICNVVLPGNSRCKGSIPQVGPTPPSPPSPPAPPSPGPANNCNPATGCNVCATCCKSYLSNQADCNACVSQSC